MTISFPPGYELNTTTRLLTLPLAAIGEAPTALRAMGGLPEGALEVASANLVLSATPCDGPMFGDTIERLADSRRRDVMLIRTGLHPETLDPVTVDVALTTECGAFLMTHFAFYRHYDTSLWLVPIERGPFVEIGARGLRLEMISPFVTADERSDGICRASAEIVRSNRSAREL